jgi:hypothetical protein
MQSIPAGNALKNATDYQLRTLPNVDKRIKHQRTAWKRRNATIADAPPTNLNSLEANRRLCEAIRNNQAARRAAALKKCTTPKWSKEQLRQVIIVLDAPGLKKGLKTVTVKTLTEEMNRHGFKYNGTIKDATRKLLHHLNQVEHAEATTQRATGKGLLDHFVTSG